MNTQARFEVRDGEAYVLASTDSLVEALECGRSWKHSVEEATGPNPYGSVFVIDTTGMLLPINM
jgi:hypothetical protein